jgi:surface-anchored protein
MVSRRNVCIGLIVMLAVACGPAATATPVVYSSGHGDIRADWNPAVNPTVFTLVLHADAGAIIDGAPLATVTNYAPGDALFRIPATANLGRVDNPTGFWSGNTSPPNNGYNFATSTYDYTGTGVGDPLWVISNNSIDAAHYGTPWIGLGAEPTGGSVGGNPWVTNLIYFRLTSFSFDGSEYGTTGGNFSASTGSGSRRWDTADGSFANDSFSVGAGSHTHPRLYFTEPGLYSVGITVTGTHVTYGEVSGTGTFTFEVVPEPAGLTLVLGGLLAGAIGLAGRQRSRMCRKILERGQFHDAGQLPA